MTGQLAGNLEPFFISILLGSLFSIAAAADDIPFTFNTQGVSTHLRGTAEGGVQVIQPFGVEYRISPLIGQRFQADTYQQLVSQVRPFVEQGLGSRAGPCDNCACSTRRLGGTFPLSSDGTLRGTVGNYTTGPVVPGTYTRSIPERVYPGFIDPPACDFRVDCTFLTGDDGTERLCGRVPECVIMNFEYNLHTCTKLSRPGEPFEAEEQVQTITDVGSYLALRNYIPCPLQPYPPRGVASVLTKITSGPLPERVCRGNDLTETLILSVGINTEIVDGERIFSETESEIGADEEVTVKVPLGAYFFLSVSTNDDVQSIDIKTVDSDVQTVTGSTLFPGKAVVEFDEAAAAEKKFLLAVHLGDTVLEVIDEEDNSVTINLEVGHPASLGSEQVTFDPVFVEAAHQSGIMPSLLKGIADRESGFNPMAYRYEPIGSDLKAFQSGNQQRLKVRPHRAYRFKTQSGLDEGVFLDQSTKSVREIYFIDDGQQVRRIKASDEFISALNIFKTNDDFLGPQAPGVGDQSWSDVSQKVLRDSIRLDPSILDFTAQTHLAASFGLMQVLYTSAIRPANWQGLKTTSDKPCHTSAELCSPVGLFDTMKNIELGGGSVGVASTLLYIDLNHFFRSSNPSLSGIEGLENAVSNVLIKYNEGTGYATDVLSRSSQYLPVPVSAIIE